MLLVYGVDLQTLESLVWGKSEAVLDPSVIERLGLERAKRRGEVAIKGGGTDSSPRVGTPIAFRDLLLSIARTTQPETEAA